MRRRIDDDRLFPDIQTVIQPSHQHGVQPLLDNTGWQVGHAQVNAAVFGAPPLLYLKINAPRGKIPAGKLHLLRVVSCHETLAVFVKKSAAFTPHRLGYQMPGHRLRDDVTGGVELEDLHINQFGSRFQGHPVTVTSLPVGGNAILEYLTAPATGKDYRFGLEYQKASLSHIIGNTANDSFVLNEQL